MQKKCKGRASSRRKKYGSITVIQTTYFTILVEQDFFNSCYKTSWQTTPAKLHPRLQNSDQPVLISKSNTNVYTKNFTCSSANIKYYLFKKTANKFQAHSQGVDIDFNCSLSIKSNISEPEIILNFVRNILFMHLLNPMKENSRGEDEKSPQKSQRQIDVPKASQ